MEWILLISFALAVRVADFADPAPPNPGDNILDINLRAFPDLNKGNESSGSTTFADGICVPMQGHCLGEDDKTASLSEVIQITTSSPLVCRNECKKNLNIGGCEFKKERIGHKVKYTCTKYGGPGISGDGQANVKCWNMLKCGTDNKMKLVEGDIVETENVIKARSGKFDAIKGSRYKWPKSGGLVRIPYTMYLGSKAQGRVRWAVNHFTKNTCVRWVARSNQRDYVSMFDGGGCYSMIGKQGGAQKLSLGSGCLWDSGTTVHEMLHAMGWYHEQSRDDRDNYITVYWRNIQSSMQYNFKKYNGAATTYGIPYDKKSVMQYGRTAFGRGKVTMADKTNYQAQLGQRNAMTASDVAGVNVHYGCDCNVYSCKADGTKGGGGGTTDGCVDKDTNCPAWARHAENYCVKNDDWMVKKGNCLKSCNACPTPKPTTKPTPKPSGKCEDGQKFCTAIKSFCTKNAWVKENCKKSCGNCPRPDPPPVPKKVCKDIKKTCGPWKDAGYCTKGYVSYMMENCPKSCGLC